MIIDGKEIAKGILDEVATKVAERPEAAPRLTIVTCTPNFETQKYLALKKKKAAAVGIHTNVIELLADCTIEDVKQIVNTAAAECDGLVIPLPLPEKIDTNAVLAAIPTTHDVDGIHFDGEGDVLPPVVGAIAAIVEKHEVSFVDKKVTIVGAGRLVGAPSLLWVSEQGSQVTMITKDTPDTESAEAIISADIIISGAGYPKLLTPEKIKEGVIIFDAGTSEDGGALAGDADPACAEKAALFTPVPGGIGPITIAVLLKNLTMLPRQ